MNLFIDDLAEYLIEEWDSSLGVRDDTKEARFIVQTMDQQGELSLFQALNAHRKDWAQR